MGQNVAGQQFRNVGLANLRPAVYSLTMRGGDGSVSKFRFPLSPRSVRRQYMAMGNFYDVAGSPKQGGVNRIVDIYGNSPYIFTIEGTTGWQLHSTDGGLSPGIDALNALQTLLGSYAEANQVAQAQNGPLATLEFADSFLQSVWQVEPMGEQGYRQDAQQPLYVTYSFRFVGIRDLNQPGDQPDDPILDELTVTASSASTTLSAQFGNVFLNYSGQTSVIIN